MVVFDKQTDMVDAVEFFKHSTLNRVFQFIAVKLFKCRNKQLRIGDTFMRTKEGAYQRVYVERAPEPSDMLWENLSISLIERVWRTTKTYLWTLGVLFIALCVNVAIAYLKKEVFQKQADENRKGDVAA